MFDNSISIVKYNKSRKVIAGKAWKSTSSPCSYRSLILLILKIKNTANRNKSYLNLPASRFESILSRAFLRSTVTSLKPETGSREDLFPMISNAISWARSLRHGRRTIRNAPMSVGGRRRDSSGGRGRDMYTHIYGFGRTTDDVRSRAATAGRRSARSSFQLASVALRPSQQCLRCGSSARPSVIARGAGSPPRRRGCRRFSFPHVSWPPRGRYVPASPAQLSNSSRLHAWVNIGSLRSRVGVSLNLVDAAGVLDAKSSGNDRGDFWGENVLLGLETLRCWTVINDARRFSYVWYSAGSSSHDKC